jgi:hypothetical protein
MRLSFPTCLVFALIALGCKSKTEIVPLGPPGQHFEPVAPESVFVFSSENRVRIKHQPLARISVGFNYGNASDESARRVEEALRKRAGKLGAHGIVLGSDEEVSEEVGWSGMPAGAATAIRFLDPDRLEGIEAVHSAAELRTVVIAPLAVPEDLEVPDSIASGFTRDIHEHLLAAGFDPLPLDTWDWAWERVTGGAESAMDSLAAAKLNDPASTVEQRVLRILEEEYGVDGFLFPDMVGVQARFDGDEARWDGIRQKVGETRSTGAKILSGLLNLFVRGKGTEDVPDPSGRVTALSLEIRIENTIGARLYSARGGIELIEGADFEGGIYIGEPEPEEYEVVEVPDEALFQKRSRLERAVRIALEPLVARRGGS